MSSRFNSGKWWFFLLCSPLFLAVAGFAQSTAPTYPSTDMYLGPLDVSDPSSMADCDALQKSYDDEAARIDSEHSACLAANQANVNVPAGQTKFICSRSSCQALHVQNQRAQDDSPRISQSVQACRDAWNAKQKKIADDAAKAEQQKEEAEEKAKEDAEKAKEQAEKQAVIDQKNQDAARQARDAQLAALAQRTRERQAKLDALAQQLASVTDSYDDSVNNAVQAIAESTAPTGQAHPLGKASDDDSQPDYDVSSTSDSQSAQPQSSQSPQPATQSQAAPMYEPAHPTKDPFTYYYAVSHYSCRVEGKETRQVAIYAEVYGVCIADAGDNADALKQLKLSPMTNNRFTNDQIAKIKCAPGSPVYLYTATSFPFSSRPESAARDAAEKDRTQNMHNDIAAGIAVESQTPSPSYSSNCD